MFNWGVKHKTLILGGQCPRAVVWGQTTNDAVVYNNEV